VERQFPERGGFIMYVRLRPKCEEIERHRPAPGVIDRVAVSTPGYLLASLRGAPALRLQKTSNAISSLRGLRQLLKTVDEPKAADRDEDETTHP